MNMLLICLGLVALANAGGPGPRMLYAPDPKLTVPQSLSPLGPGLFPIPVGIPPGPRMLYPAKQKLSVPKSLSPLGPQLFPVLERLGGPGPRMLYAPIPVGIPPGPRMIYAPILEGIPGPRMLYAPGPRMLYAPKQKLSVPKSLSPLGPQLFPVLERLGGPPPRMLYAPEPQDASSRIVGGSDATAHSHPHIAALFYKSNDATEFRFICGASLIDKKWLYTAAHCLEFDTNFANFRIGLGYHNLKELNGNEQLMEFERYILCPGYDGTASGYPNDCALIELKEAATLNDKVQAIALPDSDGQDFVNEDCMITGWGKLSGSSTVVSDILQEVKKAVITNASCSWKWFLIGNIMDTHICVHTEGLSACNGDSGGPLSCNVNGREVLAGATSWGLASCSGSMPSVYTRTSKYLDFIRTYVP